MYCQNQHEGKSNVTDKHDYISIRPFWILYVSIEGDEGICQHR